MTPLEQIDTARLVLRCWRDDDLAPFAAMNADPRVREHFPGVQTREDSDASAAYFRRGFAERGFGNWALERKDTRTFIGFCGLWQPRLAMPFEGGDTCIEIGWRLAHAHWGQGLASEAARAALDDGFGRIGLAAVVSFTVPGNRRSLAVMQRIGLADAGVRFEHPGIAARHPLRTHVLYRVTREQWHAANPASPRQPPRPGR